MSIILDFPNNMVNVKQKDYESLQEYTKRFKTLMDVMESHIGSPIELIKYTTKMKEFNPMNCESIEQRKERAQE
jgi:hypothetical protein